MEATAVPFASDEDLLTMPPHQRRDLRNVLLTKSAWDAYNYCLTYKGDHLEAFQALVIASRSPRCALAFAQDIPGASVEALQEVIISTRAASVAPAFAATVKGASRERLEDLVLTHGDADTMACFAQDVPGASILRLLEGILDSLGYEEALLYGYISLMQSAFPSVVTEDTIATLSLKVVL